MHDRVQWCDVAVERNERVVEGLLKSSVVQPMTSRITSSDGEQAMRVDARSPPEPSGSPRFQGRLREPAASSTAARQSSSEDWDQAKCRDRLLPIDPMQPQCAGADDEVAMSNLARTSSTGIIRTSSTPVHVGDGRIDLFGGGLNAEERDQFINHVSDLR